MIIQGRAIVNRMTSGVWFVKIASVRYLRDAKGEIKLSNGMPYIDIIFENKEKKRIALTIIAGDKSQWIIDAICNATGIHAEEGQIDVSDLIGQKIWIIVANEYIVHDGKRRKDSTGEEICYQKVLTKFFKDKPEINDSELIIEKDSL